jgi:C4-dicarboxylate-specific signal transduction histidine kinase
VAGDEDDADDMLAFLSGNIARLGAALPALAEKLRAAAAVRGQPVPPSLPAISADVMAQRFAGFAEFLRRFGRLDERPRRPTSLPPLLREIVALLRPELSMRARVVEKYASSPLVLATERQLAHLVANLLVNAAQAIADGDADTNRIEIRTGSNERGWAVIDVEDSGAGVPDELRDQIFEPYFSTKRGRGSGLGLTIARELVDDLGGELRLTSAPRRGAHFRIELPPAPGRAR